MTMKIENQRKKEWTSCWEWTTSTPGFFCGGGAGRGGSDGDRERGL